MRKIIILSCLTFLLTACNDASKTTVCTLKNKKEHIDERIEVEYEDNELISFEMTSTSLIDEEKLDIVGEKDLEDELKKALKAIEQDGVSADLTYDSKKKEVTRIITIQVKDLNKSEYVTYAIPSDKQVDKFIWSLENQNYKCKDE